MTDKIISDARKRLTPDEWDEACAMWRSGDYTLDDLSKKFGITTVGLHKRFQRNGIQKGSHRQAAEQILSEELRKQAEEKAKELATGFYSLRDFCFKANTVIARRVASELSGAITNNKPIDSLKDTMKTLELAQSVIFKSFDSAQKMAADVIKEDDTEALPVLVVEPLTKEDIDEIRRQQKAEENEMFGLEDDLDIIEGDE